MTDYKRQQEDRFKRVKDTWRRPRGTHSKQRLNRKGKPAVPGDGRGSPTETRGLHPSGYREVMVHRPADLDDVDADEEAVRIASKVGGRKREAIETAAADRDIKVLNPTEVDE